MRKAPALTSPSRRGGTKADQASPARERDTQSFVLASQIAKAEQRERKRLAHLLHDHLQQILVAARFQACILKRSLVGDSNLAKLKELDNLLVQAISESRSLAVELCPPILHQEDLREVLRWLGNHMHARFGLQVEVIDDGGCADVPEEPRQAIFQIVRELLLNVAKHAQVDRARIRIRRETAKVLCIDVEDDGVGITVESGATDSFGLFTARERTEVLRGTMEIESEPGRGTRITIHIPLATLEPAGDDAKN